MTGPAPAGPTIAAPTLAAAWAGFEVLFLPTNMTRQQRKTMRRLFMEQRWGLLAQELALQQEMSQPPSSQP
jgi:hypothetical protein